MNQAETMKLTVLYIKALKDCVGTRSYDDKIQAMRDVFRIIGFDYEEVETLYDETEGYEYD